MVGLRPLSSLARVGGKGSNQGTGCPSDCAVALNDFGDIAGTYIDASNVTHGFVRSPDGKVTPFDAPGTGNQGTNCLGCGLGLNLWGEVTGSYLDQNGVFHGYLRLPTRPH